MSNITTRKFSRLQYEEPVALLRALHSQTQRFARGDLGAILPLRKGEGKTGRERREAAMFCHLLDERFGVGMLMAIEEDSDFDFVATWSDGRKQLFAPVQLKELPPEAVPSQVMLEQLLESLKKYADSRDLLVAVHLNRAMRIDPVKVAAPNLAIGGLWFFGAIAPDLTEWGLWGDMLSVPTATAHSYPDR